MIISCVMLGKELLSLKDFSVLLTVGYTALF